MSVLFFIKVLNNFLCIALRALELSAGKVNPSLSISFLKVKKNLGEVFFWEAISLWWVVVPSSKIDINLPWTNEKLHCKVEPNMNMYYATITYI